MKAVSRTLICLLLYFISLPVQAYEVELSVLLDEARNMPVDSAIYGSQSSNFEQIKTSTANFGFLDGGVWIRVDVLSSMESADHPVLELKNPNLDVVLVYEISSNGMYFHNPTGDQFHYSKRKNKHRYYQFEVNSKPDQLKYFLIYVDNIGDQLFIPIELSEKEALEERDYYLQYSNGLYFGIIVFVLILNFFMYFSLKEKANFQYVLYLFGLFFLQFSLEGYGMELLWGDNAYMANHANPIFASFSIAYLLQFCRNFLSLNTYLPRLDKYLKRLFYLLFAIFLISLFNISWTYKISILAINAITFILTLIILPIGIYVYKKGFKAARFFITAFTLLVLAVFLFILRNFGVLPSNFFTEKALQIGSSAEVILLSLAIVDKFRLFKDEAYDRLQELNELKSKANVELEIKVNERTKELKEQKDLVEHKNEEITQSITYAKRIQEAILPPTKYIESHLKESFILYIPKDIVAGDFYWFEALGNEVYFAAADCTGHGVPGAMVSVVCSNAMNRVINELKISEPRLILDKVRELVVETFEKSDRDVHDGMDIAFCRLNTKTLKLSFAGAQNALYLVTDKVGDLEEDALVLENKMLEEYKGDKQPIGKYAYEEPFKQRDILLKKGDVIYISSDGFPDQFGGEKGKKFKYKPFKNLLLSIHGLPMSEQKTALSKALHDWKGELDQVDDVCVIGVRV